MNDRSASLLHDDSISFAQQQFVLDRMNKARGFVRPVIKDQGLLDAYILRAHLQMKGMLRDLIQMVLPTHDAAFLREATTGQLLDLAVAVSGPSLMPESLVGFCRDLHRLKEAVARGNNDVLVAAVHHAMATQLTQSGIDRCIPDDKDALVERAAEFLVTQLSRLTGAMALHSVIETNQAERHQRLRDAAARFWKSQSGPAKNGPSKDRSVQPGAADDGRQPHPVT